MIEPKETESNDLPQGKSLSRKQKEAIPSLIGARSLEAGCRKAKISKGTLFRWMKEENFKSALEAARQAVIQESLERLKAGVSKAVDGILALAGDKDKWIKIRACEKVLDFFMKVREVEELEGRLEKIERIIFERKTFR